MAKLLLFFLITAFFLLYPILYTLYPTFAHSQTQIVEMTKDGFSPDPVSVDQNSTIIFLNKDTQAHWPASNVHPTHEIYPEFDPRVGIKPGKSWTFKPKNIGTWKYHDHLLPHMRGTIIVESEGANLFHPPGGQEQTTFPLRKWELGLDWIKERINKFVNNITSLFKSEKQVKLPDANQFIKLAYLDQQKILEDSDPQKSWVLVKETFKGQGGSSGNIHDLAHLAGSLIYTKKGFDGLVSCSADFAFGCFHGFLDSAFKKNLDHLLDAQSGCLKLGPANSGPVASCIHGIGHGIASFNSVNDLKKSLADCKKLTSGREFCFDGVFMEFVRSAPETFFKKDDPYYPCKQLEKEYGYTYSLSCGRNQPAMLMSRFKMGFDEIIPICSNSDSKPFKESCFDSLGFSLASTGDPEKIISGCQKIGMDELVAKCIKAAAGELVFQEVPGWEEKSKAVCSGFKPGEKECLENVGRLIKEYGKQDKNSYIREQLKSCYENGGRDGCYKKAAQVLYDQFGLAQTLRLLKNNEGYQEVYVRCHEVTHYLSRLEYEKQQSISKVYAICDSTCHGGCYHGTLEAYLKQNPNVEFAKICGQKQDYQKPLEFYECLHGLGHAAMFVTDMELKQSLALCDTIPDQFHKEKCFTGVFMENSSSSTSFDHQSKYIKADDPFYPCNSLEEKYQAVCWQYQSSYFSILTHQDWKKVADMCLQTPSQYQHLCFRTIGTNQVGFTKSLKVMKDDCDIMPTDNFKAICVAGVVSSLSYRFVGETEKMMEFCSVVGNNEKESCFKQIGAGLLEWSADKNLAKKECSKIPDPKGLSWCMSVI